MIPGLQNNTVSGSAADPRRRPELQTQPGSVRRTAERSAQNLPQNFFDAGGGPDRTHNLVPVAGVTYGFRRRSAQNFLTGDWGLTGGEFGDCSPGVIGDCCSPNFRPR